MKRLRPIALRRSSVGSTEPVTLAQAKEHLRIDAGFTADDTYITSLIQIARESIEESVRRCLVEDSTYIAGYARFPNSGGSFRKKEGLWLVMPPFIDITSVDYLDVNEDSQTIDSSNYRLESTSSQGSFLHFKSSYSLPTLSSETEAPVTVTYTTGYTTIPKPLYAALLLLITHYYNIRAVVSVGSMPFPIPRSVDHLIAPYKTQRI